VLKRCSKHKHQSKEETKMIWVGLEIFKIWVR